MWHRHSIDAGLVQKLRGPSAQARRPCQPVGPSPLRAPESSIAHCAEKMLTALTAVQIIVAWIATYAIASDVAFIGIRRFLGTSASVSDRALFALSRGVGPAVVSVVLYVLLLVFPGQGRAFYLAGVALPFLATAAYGRCETSALFAAYSSAARALSRAIRPHATGFLLPTVVFLSMCSLVLGIAYPITEHDSLSVAMEARIMSRDMTMDNYLAVDEPDAATGYFARGFRPPFLHMLYLWFALVAGGEYMELIARTVSPIYGLHCLLIVAYAVRCRWSARSALWAAFCLATAPLFFYLSYGNGIDPPRLYLSFVAMYWLSYLAARPAPGLRLGAVAGLFCGLALYCHLLSAAAVLAGVAMYLLLNRQPLVWAKLRLAAAVTVVAMVAGAQYHYLMSPAVRTQLDRSFSANFIWEWADLASDVSTRVVEMAQSTPLPSQPVEPNSPPVAPPTAKPKPPIEKAASSVARPKAVPKPASPAAKPVTVAPPPVVKTKPIASAILEAIPPPKPKSELLLARGHDGSALSSFVFGRLQMFTGVEYFGAVFYLLIYSVGFWRRESATALDKIALTAIAVYAVVVLSGVRAISWSNPRYIGSVLLVAAYFIGPSLASLEQYLQRRSKPLAGALMLAMALIMTAPVVGATAVRGAKIEITNSGSFYSDFRSLRWLTFSLEDPQAAVGQLWQQYMGIRKTVQFFGADQRTKLKNAHDYFGAIDYIRSNTEADASALVFRDTKYHYYAERRGYVWFHPDMFGYRKAENAEEMHTFLQSKKVTHVVIDSFSERQEGFRDYSIGPLLDDRNLTDLVHQKGSARVYALRDLETPRRAGAAAGE